MGNPYRWLKKRWYRRQAKRAIWFLRYVDRMTHGAGWNRAQRKKFWDDFIKFPGAREATLNQLSVINHIKIRELRRTNAERTADAAVEQLNRITRDYLKLKMEHAQCRRPEDVIPADGAVPVEEATGPTGPHLEEAQHEVHGV